MCEDWVTFWQLGTLELVNEAVAFLFLVLGAVEVFGDVRQFGLEFLELFESDGLVVAFFVEDSEDIALGLLLLVHFH